VFVICSSKSFSSSKNAEIIKPKLVDFNDIAVNYLITNVFITTYARVLDSKASKIEFTANTLISYS
jgi:hypothetical protein